jgi:hypothetical protein
MDLRLSKSHARQTKHQIRINYKWDGKEANFADSILSFVDSLSAKCVLAGEKLVATYSIST